MEGKVYNKTDFQFTRGDKATEFYCGRCKQAKVSKIVVTWLDEAGEQNTLQRLLRKFAFLKIIKCLTKHATLSSMTGLLVYISTHSTQWEPDCNRFGEVSDWSETKSWHWDKGLVAAWLFPSHILFLMSRNNTNVVNAFNIHWWEVSNA